MKWICKKCGWKWETRRDRKPAACPACKSDRWDGETKNTDRKTGEIEKNQEGSSPTFEELLKRYPGTFINGNEKARKEGTSAFIIPEEKRLSPK